MPRGVGVLRFIFLVAGLLVFAGLYVYFVIEIWDASGAPPDLDPQLVYIASALGGVLGTFFAVSLGIQRRDPDTDQRKLDLGATLLGNSGGAAVIIATAALWVYAGIGAAAGVTAILQTVETPDAIKALAATFGGYGFAIFSAAFGGSSR